MEFFDLIHVNNLNLKFTMTYDRSTITFLNVRIFSTSEGHLSSTHFRKSTAGNTVLHIVSFHPTSLKNSIPFRQFLRLHCNCSDDSLFREEAGKLQNRMLARGYSQSCLRKAYNKVFVKPRNDLLYKPHAEHTPSGDRVTRVILRFSNQQMRDIFQRNWSLLTDDPKIQQFVSNTPAITFRRAMSIKDSLVQSEFRDMDKKEHCPVQGSFPCGHCSHCPLIKKKKRFLLLNSELFSPYHFANCQTRGVVYLMLCKCKAFYIGKTKHEFWRCIAKHTYRMRIGNQHLPLGRHIVVRHNYQMPKIFFVVLDQIHIPSRGGDWNKLLLQREQKWIFRLRATTYPGQNESISFAPFLKGFASGKTQ